MKNILLAVCGLSPQVITETVYALLHAGRQVHAIEVITTRLGRERLLAGLFDPQCRRLDNLLADFGLDAKELAFSPRNIHTLQTATGAAIEDIISPDDNEILLQTCLELTFSLSREQDNAVWFLVAGGRKTMTSCLTLAAQLYGRPQDRILHVLVSPDFENCPEFWYPPRKSEMVKLLDAKQQPLYKDSRYADIKLINIPFVSVRNRLDHDLLAKPQVPAELMRSLIRDTPGRLTINLAEGKIIYDGMEMDMHPARLALYAFFADSKKHCLLDRSCTGCNECFQDAAAVVSGTGVAEMYARIPGGRLLSEMSDTGISSLSKENFNSYKSKIRQDILRTFGQSQVEKLAISTSGGRPASRYGIRLDRRLIKLEW